MSLVEIIFKANVKQVLVEMASNDELPMDMNELDIDEVFDKADKLTKNEHIYKFCDVIDKANNFLIDSDEANVIEQIEIIKYYCKKNPTFAIDHLNGVQVVEQFEYTFTVEEFLKEIGVID